MHWDGDDWRQPSSPNGILPTLTSAFADGLPGIWVTASVGGAAQADRPHPTGLPLSAVPVDAATWTGYFHRACKETLWPVLMSEPERLVLDERAWADYRTVNARFARHIDARAAPGATVWLHDYNLWLVPGLLRRLRPDLRTGLFHHTPFPAPETFAALPVAAELRRSLACLDWAGFHTPEFADRFRRTLAGLPGPPRTAVHPLGVDRSAVEALVRRRVRAPGPAAVRVVLSVERLDYAKAPVQKVDAFERLLARRPELRGRTVFRLVCPPPEPGITAYDLTRQHLEQRVAEVNDSWRQGSWQPVDYLPHRLSPARVIDEYLAADVLWVTSFQDGMNLTAKEFVAARSPSSAGPPSRASWCSPATPARRPNSAGPPCSPTRTRPRTSAPSWAGPSTSPPPTAGPGWSGSPNCWAGSSPPSGPPGSSARSGPAPTRRRRPRADPPAPARPRGAPPLGCPRPCGALARPGRPSSSRPGVRAHSAAWTARPPT
ncbi:trehalose-6-phosphate synthase [Kitasatospora saccharophila]|uniref:trehalose-6-phosphate synthase n=1 Tax=Kitasatospora saccharophila TaxID=407973 RepID=UPI003645E340